MRFGYLVVGFLLLMPLFSCLAGMFGEEPGRCGGCLAPSPPSIPPVSIGGQGGNNGGGALAPIVAPGLGAADSLFPCGGSGPASVTFPTQSSFISDCKALSGVAAEFGFNCSKGGGGPCYGKGEDQPPPFFPLFSWCWSSLLK